MPIRRVVLCAALVLAATARAALAAPASPYEDRFEAHRRALAGRAGRAEAVAPLAALVRLDESVAPGAWRPLLEALAADRRTDPLVAAQAIHQLALDDVRRGAAEEAERRWRGLGLVGDFWLLGPFDAQGRSGLERVYPPEERPFDPRGGGRFAGKEREVGWRRTGGAFRDGALLVDALLRPDADAVAYASTSLESDRPQAVALRLGTPGPFKLWVNGRVVLERDVVRPSGPDQDAVLVALGRGRNEIVLKTVVTTGAWRIYLRATRPDGRPADGVRANAAAVGPVARGGPAARGAARSLGVVLRRRAERAPRGQRAAAWMDYAWYLALARTEDDEARPIDAALGAALAAGAGAEASALLAEVTPDEDKRRDALERIASGGGPPGERALALSALGELARVRRRDAAAVDSFRAALAADPRCWPATLALASEEQGAGFVAAALARLDALPAGLKEVPRVRRARVRALEALGRRREAEAELRRLLALWPSDLDVLQDLGAALRARGEVEEATGLLGRAADLRPDLVFLGVDHARMLEGRGALPEARAALLRMAERLPDEPRVHEELGRLLARAGEPQPALASLRRALELRPQNPTLRRFAERLRAEISGGDERTAAAEDLARAHAEDPVAVAKAAFEARKGDAGADPAIVLMEKHVVRVHRNGLSEVFAQRLVEVRTERGARDNQEFYVRYTPGNQEIEIRRAQILRRGPDGEVEISEATARDDRDLSEPWYGLYYDNRAEVVSFEGLRAGDVLHIEYTVADVSAENAMADYFGDLQYIAESIPKRRWEYVLVGPRERSFHFNEPRLSGLVRKKEERGGDVVHRLQAKDVPKIDAEPSMPGWAEVTPYVHVSTYKSWEDVGRWYWHLVRDQLLPDEAVRRAAREATAGLTAEADRIRALHRFVLEATRYVGLEFGIHGYKPYRVSQVLSRRFGDCKDKASLLVALLKEVGIDAELVLLRTRRGGRVATMPASLAVFDHAVAYVPSQRLYLDGTAEFSGMAELPEQDQGAMVLRVGPKGSTLTETPVFPSRSNRVARAWAAAVEADGAARVEETVTVAGQAAPEWRRHYQTPGERQERYTKVWADRFPGAALDALDVEGAEDRNRPVQVRAVVRVPGLGEGGTAGTLVLPVTSREGEYVRSYARLSRRKHDLVLSYPWQHEEVLTFRVPEGWHVARAPEPRREEAAVGTFTLEVEPVEQGRAIRVRSAMDVTDHRISPDEYDGFRRFLRAVDAALGQRLVLRKDEP